MRREKPNPVPIFVIVAFAAEFVLAVLHVVIVGCFPEIHESLTELVDLNGEGNLPAWFSSVQLFSIAMLFLVLTIDTSLKKENPWAAALVVVVFVFLSVDEAAQLHERFGQLTDVLLPGGSRLNSRLWRTGIGNIILAVVALVALALCWRVVRRHLRFDGSWKLILGMLIFVGAASIPETLSNFITSRNVMVLERVVEEIGEMAGITMVLWGTLELLAVQGLRLDFAKIVGVEQRMDFATQQDSTTD